MLLSNSLDVTCVYYRAAHCIEIMFKHNHNFVWNFVELYENKNIYSLSLI